MLGGSLVVSSGPSPDPSPRILPLHPRRIIPGPTASYDPNLPLTEPPHCSRRLRPHFHPPSVQPPQHLHHDIFQAANPYKRPLHTFRRERAGS